MKSVYLAGAMTKRRDGGVRWRKSITPLLKKYGVKEVNDPTINEKKWFDMVYDYKCQSFYELKTKNRRGYRTLMNVIRKHDEALIDSSDAIIFYLDAPAFQSDGTLLELNYVRDLLLKGIKKDIYVVLRVPWIKVFGWSFAVIQEYAEDRGKLFYNLTDFKAYIKESKSG